jgi:peptidoglycan/LPS O-acetylase OafA/YrhL
LVVRIASFSESILKNQFLERPLPERVAKASRQPPAQSAGKATFKNIKVIVNSCGRVFLGASPTAGDNQCALWARGSAARMDENRRPSGKDPAGLRRRKRRSWPKELSQREIMSRLVVLDELRGVAIVFILLCHVALIWSGAPWADALNQVALGVGVDLFFVISGFVISRNLAGIHAAKFWPAARSFWLRRFFRIALPAWAVVAAVGAAELAYGSAPATMGDLAAAASFFGDIYWGRCFEGAPSCGAALTTSHFWSLALEMQFYAIAPLLGILRRPRATILIGATVCALAATARPWGGFWWALRVDGLLIGFWLAGEAARNAAWLARAPRLSVGLAVYWVVIAALLGRIFASGPGGVGLTLIAAIMGFVVVGRLRAGEAATPLGRLLRRVGELSFSIYLVHMPLLFAAHVWTPASPALSLTVGLVATLVAGVGLDMFVTTPAQAFGRRKAGHGEVVAGRFI